MPRSQEDDSNRLAQLELLTALASGTTWNRGAELVTGTWTSLGDATTAILIAISGPNELELVCSRINSDNIPVKSRTTVEAPFALLLDQQAVVELVVESGLVGGVHLQVFPWPDLCACLVIQAASERAPMAAELGPRIIAACRTLLGRCTDRAVLLPDASLLEAMAEFAAGAGHEINNPLASILGQTQLLLKAEQLTDKRQGLETIGSQALRIRDMIGNAMLFARPPAPEVSRINLVELAQQTLVPLNAIAAEANIEIRLASTSDAIELEADRTQISTLISQLVRNSIESIRSSNESGEISVTLHDDQPGTVELCVTDSGPGLRNAIERRHAFNPFFSGRSAGRGLGFGLCLAWQIVRMHGGFLLHYSPDDGGAAFHVALPASHLPST